MKRALAVLSFLAVLATEAAALSLLDKTVTWREEVVLASGEKILVDRSVSFGPDAFFRRGRGGLSKQSLTFTWQGRKVAWHNEDSTLANHVPLTLEFEDAAPLLVLPVRDGPACHAHGFPQDGLATLRWQVGKWVRGDAKRLPAGARVNLLQNVWGFQHESPARGLVVDADWKRQAETSLAAGDRQGHLLAGRKDDADHSCARLRPPPDPELDASIQRVGLAERAAATVEAVRVSHSTDTEPVSPHDVQANLGQWSEAAYVAPTCRGIVDRVERRYRHAITTSSMSSQLAGYTVQLAPGASQPRIGLEGYLPSLSNVVCDDRTVLVVRRASAERLLVIRFERSGKIVDATWVQLPGAAELSTDSKAWPSLWSFVVHSGTRLTIVVADYAYTATANQGGILRRKSVYEVALPTR